MTRTFYGAAQPVLDAARHWSDPRQKALRKRRRARRRASLFGSASGMTVVGTASAAVASAPEWIVVGGGGVAVFFAVPATLGLMTYRRLRGEQLPPARPSRRIMPGIGSAARPPMMRLAGAERSLHQLLGVLTRAGAVAPADLDETAETAAAAASALTAVAYDIVAMERAGDGSPGAAAELKASIAAAVRELDDGVDQFDGLVVAAAQLTAPQISGSTATLDARREALLGASDRLQGWAYALGELRP